MALPALTPSKRAEVLERAKAVRKERGDHHAEYHRVEHPHPLRKRTDRGPTPCPGQRARCQLPVSRCRTTWPAESTPERPPSTRAATAMREL